MQCERCHFVSPPGFAFCGKCGAPLAGDITPEVEALTAADLDHLRNYLPKSLIEALRFDHIAPAPRLLDECLGQLDRVLEATRRHLPPYLVESVLLDPVPGRVGGAFLSGTLLFADISGFTAISERLARIGQEGAEEITAIVNRYFTVMLELLQRNGGQLLTFGGDALLSLFLESPDDPGYSALWAAQAALQMQAAMVEFSQTSTSQGVFPLHMKVSLRAGRFFAAQLGTPEQMEHALFGSDVNAVAQGEKLAAAGQVILDDATASLLAVACDFEPVQEGFVRLIRMADVPLPLATSGRLEPLPPAASAVGRLQHAVTKLDALTPYLSAGILPRLTGEMGGASLEGEHRLVATLFAMISGLDDVTDYLESEAAITATLNRYFVTMQRAVQQYGGVINKIDLSDHGSKLLAFFGAPAAHENDAERAVRAALDMQAALRRENLSPDVARVRLSLEQRIGLSYGSVFAGYAGADWRHEYTVMGDNVNLAARLMTTAADGEVVVNDTIQRSVKALFDFQAREPVSLKGKSEPVPNFVVLGSRAAPDSVRGLEGLQAPLVGRAGEWQQLLQAADEVQAGHGRIVRVMGEAGLGKSRLVAEWRRLFPQPQRWLEARCLSYTESVSYFPFLELVRQLLDLRADDPPADTLVKLQAICLHRFAPVALQEALPYLASFLGVPLPPDLQDKVRYLDAEALQRRIIVALRVILEIYAAPGGSAGPLAVCLDDVHWIDQASATLLENLLSLTDQLPLLFVLIYRPERESLAWRLHEKATREFDHATVDILLQGLSPADSLSLLNHLIPLERWPDGLQDLILSRSEGNPLYMEEMLRVLMETGSLTRDGNGLWQARALPAAVVIPATLQGLLMTRLDRLDEAPRRTAQVGSIAGRTVPWDVLAQLTTDPPPRLNANLAHLQRHEIFRQTQRQPEIIYAFRHALMQSVCYESLPARVRRAYHGTLAEYLERQTADSTRRQNLYPQIAHHAFAGQSWERALQYLLLAGRQAQARCANQESADYFTRALQCVTQQPALGTPATVFAIQMALGELATISGQYDQAQGHLLEGLALARTNADSQGETQACRWLARLYELQGLYPPAFEWIERGLEAGRGQASTEVVQLNITAGLIHTRQGDYARALVNVQVALQMAERLGDLAALARATNMLGLVALNRGDARAAGEHFQQGRELYTQAGDLHGQAMSHNLMASAYFNSGQLSLADAHYRQAHEIFGMAGDFYNQAFADNNLGEIALNQGRLDEALTYYQSALRSFEKIGASPYVQGVVQMNLGAVLIGRQDPAGAPQATEYLLASQTLFDQAQARDFLPELHRHLARAALMRQGLDTADAEARLALALSAELDMRGEAGCAQRVLGEVALARGQLTEAERHLLESSAILKEVADETQLARSQLVLARVYRQQGDFTRARELVAESRAAFERLGAGLDLAEADSLAQSQDG